MMTSQIDIDFDVYKALTVRRKTQDTTYNDVLREMLNLPPVHETSVEKALASRASSNDLVRHGVTLLAGTELRATYKDQRYVAKIEKGKIAIVGGGKSASPSRAAKMITGTSTNGWNFWSTRLPGQEEWVPLNTLRKGR